MMLEKLLVLSGGQTGCDQGALRAAKAAGVRTGGWVPRGFLTEDGPAPWLADYGLREHDSADYRDRTLANVGSAYAVLWYGSAVTPGGKLTLSAARRNGIEAQLVNPYGGEPLSAAAVAEWVRKIEPGWQGTVQLLVAGNRESKSLGIGEATERHFGEVLRLLKEGV